MNRFRKVLCVALVLLLLVASVPAVPVADLGFGITASALNATGKCGKTATYTFDSATGKLTIEGTGKINAEAFYQNKDIKEVVIGDGIAEIGADAFNGCSNLTTLDLGNTVMVIGDNAFYGCDNLTDVDIPDSVITIDNGAFQECDNLTSVEIPDSVVTIGYYAFWHCDNLISVDIGKSVKTIYGCAFYNCTSLESINIPKTVTSIGNEAFRYCPSLYDVYYEGSEAEWKAISIGANNTALENAEIHFGSVSEPSTGCEHTYLWVAGTSSTCIVSGIQGHYECDKCDKLFKNDANKTEVTLEELTKSLDPSNHATTETELIDAKEATCTAKGYTGDTCYKCCGAVKSVGTVIPVTPHNVDGVEFTKYDDEYHTKKCKACGVDTTYVKHSFGESVVTKAPTCTEKGKMTSTCVCGAEKRTEIPALGHDFIEDKCSRCDDYDVCKHDKANTLYVAKKNPTCTEDGFKAYYLCQCGAKVQYPSLDNPKVLNDEELIVSALGHDFTDTTCTEPKKCTREGCTATEGVALGHTGGRATCVAKALCSECGEEYGALAAHAYTETVSKTLPTCATEGSETKKCVCGDTRTFKLEKNDNHDWGAWEYVYAPTCTMYGSKERACRREGCTDKETAVIEKLGHDMDEVAAKVATCQATGNNKYYECDRCGKVFKDEAGAIETTVAAEIIAKGEHSFTYYVYNVNSESCTKEATETAKCDNKGCDATHTRDMVGTMVAHTFKNYVSDGNATCIVDGTKSAVCEMCKEAKDIVADKDSHKVAPHKPDPTGRKCELCNAELVCTHTYSVEKLITKTPTCTTDGQKAIVCSKCHANKPGSEEVIPALGHLWDEGVVTKERTCVNGGEMVHKCLRYCGETMTVTTDKIEHTYKEVITHATCTETGYSTFTCTMCGSHYVDKPVEAYGHMFETYFYDEGSATCYMDGTKTSTCANGCGTTNTVVDPGSKTDHEMLDFGTIKDPTCTEEGEEEAMCFYYDKCGYSEIVPIDPLGHNYITSEDENGNITYYCTVCGDTNDNSTPDTGDHTYPDQWSVIIPATCKETGVAIKICFDCNEIITMIVPKTGHKDINRDKKCDSCGKTIGVVDSDEPDIPEKPEEKPCNCDCHAGGIKAFFFKLINFFVKIFDKNARVCDCGKAH